MNTRPQLLEFVAGLPVKQLHEELVVANTVSALGKRKLARYLHDMQERGVHALSGHGSAVHFATTRLGMEKRRAQEFLHIGRHLDELSDIDAALVAGELTWSKLRIILRVAVAETQDEWLALAGASTCQDLANEVARCSVGDAPRKPDSGGLTSIRMTVRASLNLINHELWEQAKRKVSAEFRMSVTNEDLMIQAARLLLSTDVDGTVEGRTKVSHSPFQLIVHQDASGSHVHTEHGDVPLRADQAARVAEQAEIVPASRPVADPAAKTPTWLVKRVLARDNHACRNCGRYLFLQVHHLVFRSAGGQTAPEQLASLCAKCHSMIHEDLLHVAADATGEFVFSDLSGDDVQASAPPLSAEDLEIQQRLRAVVGNGAPTRKDRNPCALSLVRTRRELAPEWSVCFGVPLDWSSSSEERISSSEERISSSEERISSSAERSSSSEERISSSAERSSSSVDGRAGAADRCAGPKRSRTHMRALASNATSEPDAKPRSVKSRTVE